MIYLFTVELKKVGDSFGLIRVKESEYECNLCAFMWMDQDAILCCMRLTNGRRKDDDKKTIKKT